jgi:hypothetical protein
MWEIFCPVHGIPAFLLWVCGGNPEIIYLTFQIYRVRLVSLLRRIGI